MGRKISLIAGGLLFFFFNINCQVTGLVNVHHGDNIISVGGTDADIPGFTSNAIQIALDAVNSRGGGIVKLSPGIYTMLGPVRISSNTTLAGAGKETVLQKCDGFKTSFIIDADYGMLKATVKDASGFKIGTGIQLSDDKHNQAWDVTTAKITDIVGNVIYFDNNTICDYLSSLNGTISNACSLIEIVNAENVTVSNLLIEGNKATNEYINGCRGGGVYIHKSSSCFIKDVVVNNFNGDAFSWQITEKISLTGCEASNGEGLGFHPGTGSDGSLVENCISHHNKLDGLFLCWRVQHSIFRNNTIYANQDNGISIGHQDTDNVFENNHVYDNANYGVLFRNETTENSGHRNVFTGNVIEDNGGSGFYIGGETRDIVIHDNVIQSKAKGKQPVAVLVGPKSSKVECQNNKIFGSKEIVYEKK